MYNIYEEVIRMEANKLVDELKLIRDEQKNLKSREDKIKKELLSLGCEKIQGENAVCTITTRVKEVFNEEAFIETIKNDPTMNEGIVNKVIVPKYVVNSDELTKAVEDGDITIEYLTPFNTLTETKVVSVK